MSGRGHPDARVFGGSWARTLVTGAAVATLAIQPAPLLPIARAYAALCERYPALGWLTNHAPPLPVALLFSLVFCALLAGGWTALTSLRMTLRFNRQLRSGGPVPNRVDAIAERLGLASRLTYLSDPEPMAFCYGLLTPRIAVTAGLIERLDDDELTAVMAHERAHQRRRDPLRYLLLDVLTAAAFMFPVIVALRERLTAETELAADRAALAIAPRGAIAGALLAVVSPRGAPPGIAGLTPTETRIAQLAGDSALPPFPANVVFASLGLVGVIVLALAALAKTAELVRMVCPFCSWLP